MRTVLGYDILAIHPDQRPGHRNQKKNLIDNQKYFIRMRRVTSRPRLVSQDENDWMVHWNNVNAECEDDDDVIQERSVLRRSYVRKMSYDGLTGSLCDDTLLYLLKFLNPMDLRNLQVVNLRLNAVCRRRIVWEEHLFRKWSVLREYEHVRNIYLCDDYHIPCAASDLDSSSCAEIRCAALNFSLLHGISPAHHPSCIHPRFFRRGVKKISEGIIQFHGQVGEGDRSVLADMAFPSVSMNWEQTRAYNKKNMLSIPSRILGILCRGSTHLNLENSFPMIRGMRPFVAPYVCSSIMNDHNSYQSEVKINVTPRLVAYYEVTILSDNRSGKVEDEQGIDDNLDDCIAVGIATYSFNYLRKMPGWDQYSYGYHSDDGGIFHAKGDMIRRYGPKFGRGDTIGCGINYANHGVFFTLNGVFLGYAWVGISITIPYYPTIGIDSNNRLSINFGRLPFKFDLTSFHEQYSSQVNSLLRVKTYLNKCSTRSRNKHILRTNQHEQVLFHHGPGKTLEHLK